MKNEQLMKHFESMGARVKFRKAEDRPRWVRLDSWHRVFINAELTTSSVAFLD